AGGSSTGGSTAHGSGKDSPGVISGNTVQLPVHVPVDVSGNTADVIGVGNTADGNKSTNTSGGHTHHCTKPAPARAHPQPATARHAVPRQAAASLAHTGTGPTLPAAVASAALVLSGAALRRRFRPRAVR
ncbi:chaplin, partial [Streptomyces sp. NPDC051172]|uniref:chaplin n=1 Tax=Streptomyces sp. NPDC051172 TaxID=3155796 RepID=UPI0034469D74